MSDTAAEQLRRILHLIPALEDDKPHNVDTLAGLLGVSRAVLIRDLKSLADRFDDPGGFVEGVGIFLDGETVSVRTSLFLRPMRLTLGELAALELGLAMLRGERPPDEYAVIDGARERLGRALALVESDEPAEDAGPLRSAVLAELSPEARRIRETLRLATRDHHKARLRYWKADAPAAAPRVVCPYGLLFTSGMWYLVAHCDDSAGLRVFRLDRIASAEQLPESFEVPAAFQLESVVKEGRVFHVEDLVRPVIIRYSARIARWIAERENVPLNADGSLTREYPLADTDWAVRHVLQYGPDAEVLGPASVRKAVRERLEAALVPDP
ncbi:MAG TPA: WYL domain-containing protein [Gemmatimonadales bacterium]|jgi:proteasome accessory factor C|nr:WYL domain-containing protein [Gemmatimonadales bacterium]